MADYDLVIRTPGGTKLAEVSDYLDLTYAKRVNEPGLCAFVLNGDHPAVALLQDKAQIEVRRRDRALGLARYTDFYGIYRAQQRTRTDTTRFTARCPGALHLLSWRVIAYAANTANQTTFSAQKAETILKRLVQYNASPSATTANGRVRDGTTLNGFTITIEADGLRGTTLDWTCAWKPLLAQVQDLARVAGGDIDLIKTGAATYEFRFYAGQRGVDRRTTVLFAVNRGNLAEVTYDLDRTSEASVAIVGGQGQDSARTVITRTGATYSATNDIETFVDGRSNGTTAALQADGDAALDAARARSRIQGKILQTTGSAYGLHYAVGGALGDLVRVREWGLTWDQKIRGVTIAAKPGVIDTIDVELMDV